VNLEIYNLRFSYGLKPVLKGINMQPTPGKITTIIGPNASGKTTLLKCISGLLKPEGSVLLNGKEITKFKKEDIAKYISYLPQETHTEAALTVFETVLLGRLHSLSWRITANDLRITLKMLEEVGIGELKSKFLNELSTGQKQMVFIAQALARQPQVLLLDEPTSSLDLQHQLEILDLIRGLTSKMNIITLIALHDLNLAARYSDELIVLNSGKVYAAGTPRSILTEEMIKTVYRVNARVNINNGIPQIIPISSVQKKAF
jgi:iron complex transport system ATP-binding protein